MKRGQARKNCILSRFVPIVAALFGAINVGQSPAGAEDRHYRPDAAGHLRSGIQLYRDHQLGQARQEFEAVVKLQPEVPDAYNNVGLTYACENNLSSAQAWYRKALQVEPIFTPALHNLGLLLISTGKPDEALKCLTRCLEISPNNQPEYYYIANAQRDIGHRSEARQYYIKAIQFESNNAKAYSGLAALDLEDGRIDDAYGEIKKSLQINPSSAFSNYHLGLIEEKRGHREAAIEAYNNSLKYETTKKYIAETRNRLASLRASGNVGAPDLLGGLAGLGAANTGASGGAASSAGTEQLRTTAHQALSRHDWAEARKDLTTLSRGPAASDAIVWNNLGLAYAGEGQNDLAVDAYRKAIKLKSSGFAEAQYNLGMLLRHMGDNRGAEQAFHQAVDDSGKMHQTNPYAQNMLGIILRERGDFEGADKAFRRAIIQAGTSLPVAHYNLALLLEHTEHSRDAVSEYRTYLKLSPQGKNVQSARLRLKRLTGA